MLFITIFTPRLSAIFHWHLHRAVTMLVPYRQFSTAFFYKQAKPDTITQNSDTITETPGFCLIVRFFPNRHPISGIQKQKNWGPPPTVMNPTKPKKPSWKPCFQLILSHSSILLPASTKIPMALFLNSRLYRCYTLMTFYPGVKIFTPIMYP